MLSALSAYPLMVVIGFMFGCSLCVVLVKKNNLPLKAMFKCLTCALLCGFLGAKFFYLWVFREYILWQRLTDFPYLLSALKGGFIYFGGLIGGLGGLALLNRISSIDVWNYVNLCIPALPLAHGFGRIGCGLAGCCYGILYQGLFHIVYRESLAAPLLVPLFPVQYLETIIDWGMAVFLLDGELRRKSNHCGMIEYLMMYCLARFFIEFLRYDRIAMGCYGILSISQKISMVLLVCAIWLRRKTGMREKRIHKTGKSNSRGEL